MLEVLLRWTCWTSHLKPQVTHPQSFSHPNPSSRTQGFSSKGWGEGVFNALEGFYLKLAQQQWMRGAKGVFIPEPPKLAITVPLCTYQNIRHRVGTSYGVRTSVQRTPVRSFKKHPTHTYQHFWYSQVRRAEDSCRDLSNTSDTYRNFRHSVETFDRYRKTEVKDVQVCDLCLSMGG